MAEKHFELEALLAHAGDSLLLHYGDAKGKGLMVIDGGPAKTYLPSLKPRLSELANKGQTFIELMMVSHIDDDHIHGILELMEDIEEARNDGNPVPYVIDTLWHNSFDDIVGSEGVASFSFNTLASLSETSIPGLDSDQDGGAVLASVGQGRKLRSYADGFGIVLNSPFGDLVQLGSAKDKPVKFGHGLRLKPIAPLKSRLEKLKVEWAKELKKIKEKKAKPASLAAFVDNSVFNLASIVVMAELDKKRMLLTGDARGDDILAGLEAAGYVQTGGSIKIDLLKMPHHGSQRNIAPTFFERIHAQHYVFSGDGRHDNPEVETLRLIAEARKGEVIDLHFTYKLDDRDEFLKKNAKTFRPHYPVEGAKSLSVSI